MNPAAAVDQLVAAWNSGDWDAIEGLFASQATVNPPPDWPESAPATGWGEIRTLFEGARVVWGGDSVRLITTRVAGDRVAADFRWSVTGLGSGVGIETPIAYVLRLDEHGLIAELRYYRDYSEALAVLGD